MDTDVFFFQAKDGIRGFCLSRGLGDVYKETVLIVHAAVPRVHFALPHSVLRTTATAASCLPSPIGRRCPSSARLILGRRWPACSRPLYTSDAADELLCVDLGGRRIIKKKKKKNTNKQKQTDVSHKIYEEHTQTTNTE